MSSTVIRILSMSVALLLTAMLFACGPTGESGNVASGVESLGIRNLAQPRENVYVAGQPTRPQLQSLAASGVKHIINLRTPGEQRWDEAAYAKDLGLNYVSIPVAGPEDLSPENAARLAAALEAAGSEQTLVHCGSGNRVGALMAVLEFTQGADVPSAITSGRRWGLTGLEPVVRERLQR